MMFRQKVVFDQAFHANSDKNEEGFVAPHGSRPKEWPNCGKSPLYDNIDYSKLKKKLKIL